MNLAVLGESAADEVFIEGLAGAILRRSISRVSPFSLRSRGWPYIRAILPSVIRSLHYRSDAHGLVVIADSNHSPLHEASHEPDYDDGDCRTCALRAVARETLDHLSLRPTRNSALRVSVGVAVPAIEAWYLAGVDPSVGEASWRQALAAGRRTSHTKEALKLSVFGTTRPSLKLEIERAREATVRLSRDFAPLELGFPSGFGAMSRELRSWSP